jgi:hypothetical protein
VEARLFALDKDYTCMELDFMAFAVVLLVTALLCLGTRESSIFVTGACPYTCCVLLLLLLLYIKKTLKNLVLAKKPIFWPTF